MKTDSKKIKIVFAGGGTGGHIYPGIAVCDELKTLCASKNISLELFWFGNSKGMDRDIVEKNLTSCGGSITAFYGIPSGKLRRYFSLKNFTDLFKIFAGFIKTVFLLIKIKPDCLFSKGGFVSVPPCRAARLLRIPYFTHECDFTPGLATRLNSAGAKNIFISYDETKNCFKDALKSKCILTGNPVRPVFYNDASLQGLDFLQIAPDHKKPVLLVLGGSLGALQINTLIEQNLLWLCERFIVVHQTGKSFAQEHPELFLKTLPDYKPYDFIYSQMPSVIQAADVVVSRAGANSLWECAVCKKPMVLIPLCSASSRGDQVDNAKYFEGRNCAKVLVGDDANSENLKQSLLFFLDEQNRKQYGQNAFSLCSEKSAHKIAELVLSEAQK